MALHPNRFQTPSATPPARSRSSWTCEKALTGLDMVASSALSPLAWPCSIKSFTPRRSCQIAEGKAGKPGDRQILMAFASPRGANAGTKGDHCGGVTKEDAVIFDCPAVQDAIPFALRGETVRSNLRWAALCRLGVIERVHSPDRIVKSPGATPIVQMATIWHQRRCVC
jgi:hypothetical protein